MKQWHFFDKVYRIWVVLCVGSYDEFKVFLKNCTYKHEFEDGNSGALISLDSDTTENGNNCEVIWLKEWNEGCLVHELSHLTMKTLDDKGIPIRWENTEAFAYYQEYWFREIQRVRRTFKNGRTAKEVRS